MNLRAVFGTREHFHDHLESPGRPLLSPCFPPFSFGTGFLLTQARDYFLFVTCGFIGSVFVELYSARRLVVPFQLFLLGLLFFFCARELALFCRGFPPLRSTPRSFFPFFFSPRSAGGSFSPSLLPPIFMSRWVCYH